MNKIAEYIEREAFLKSVLTAGIGKTIVEYSEFDIGYMIRKQPTADVVPVMRGKWVNYAGKHDRGMDLRCSICNLRASNFVGGSDEWWDNSKPNYCPNCGAKMDGGEQHDD